MAWLPFAEGQENSVPLSSIRSQPCVPTQKDSRTDLSKPYHIDKGP